MVRSLPVVLACLASLGGCTLEASLGEERGLLLGAAASDGTNGPATNLANLEANVGRPFRLDRIYRRWENAAPGERELSTIAQNRIPIVSFNGRRDPDPPVSWSSVASGEHDGYLGEIARAFRALEAPVFVLYHAGPDGNEPEYGLAADYRRAYRNVVRIFRENAANNVSWVWALRSPAFATRASEFYPGNDVVDWIGANPYNYGTESEGSRWVSLRGLLSDFQNWSTAHGKPLILPEFGCVEDANRPGRKAEWFDAARLTFLDSPRIRAAAYFHGDDGPMGVDSSPDALEAFRRLALDPYVK